MPLIECFGSLRQLVVASSVLITLPSSAQSLFNKSFAYESDMGNLEPITGPSGFLICSTVRYGLGYIDGFQFTRFDSLGNAMLTRAFSAGSLVNVMQWGALSRTRSDGTFAFLFGSNPYNGGYRPSLRVFNTTSLGSINWNRQIQYANPSYAFSFAGAMDQAFEETPDDGYLITGLRTTTADSSAPVIMKLDGLGNVLWSKTYHLDQRHAWHIASCVGLNGETLLGFHVDTALLVISDNCILTKIDPDGSTLWSKRIDGFQGMLTGCVKVDGHYVVSAMDTSSIYILEMDTAGIPLWSKRYTMSFPLPTWGAGIVPTHDHGFVLTAQMPDSGGGSDVYFFKVDSLGTAQWERAYGNENYEWLVDLVENEDNTFTMLTGTQLIQNWSVYYYLSGLDSTGINDCIMPANGVLTATTFPLSLVDVVLDEFAPPMISQSLYLNDSLAYGPQMVDACLFEVGVSELGWSDELLIFPNPTSSFTTVRFPDHFLGASLIVVDLFGKRIKSTTLSATDIRVDLSTLSSGVYLYRVVTRSGRTICGKLIKE